MHEFLQSAQSLSWWLSTVVVALLVNLLSSWLSTKAETAATAWAGFRSRTSQKAQAARLALLTKALGRPQGILLIAHMETRLRVLMLIMLVATLLLMAILQGPFSRFDVFARVFFLMLIFVSLLTTIALGYVSDRYQSVLSLYEASSPEELERLTHAPNTTTQTGN